MLLILKITADLVHNMKYWDTSTCFYVDAQSNTAAIKRNVLQNSVQAFEQYFSDSVYKTT